MRIESKTFLNNITWVNLLPKSAPLSVANAINNFNWPGDGKCLRFARSVQDNRLRATTIDSATTSTSATREGFATMRGGGIVDSIPSATFPNARAQRSSWFAPRKLSVFALRFETDFRLAICAPLCICMHGPCAFNWLSKMRQSLGAWCACAREMVAAKYRETLWRRQEARFDDCAAVRVALYAGLCECLQAREQLSRAMVSRRRRGCEKLWLLINRNVYPHESCRWRRHITNADW